jgi:hypothetical protein
MSIAMLVPSSAYWRLLARWVAQDITNDQAV